MKIVPTIPYTNHILHMNNVGEFRKTRHPRNVKFDKVLETCFSGTGNSRFSEAWNLWSLGFANAWNSGIVVWWRGGVTNMRKPGTSSWRWRKLRKMADSGICRGPSSGITREDMHESPKKRKPKSGICRGTGSGVTREDIHEQMEKQSQSCCPKKSGFWVWTSGRFVNMLDEKDILVCVHTRNIPWAWGCCRYVKVPSSP
jgi:hypothetical protein